MRRVILNFHGIGMPDRTLETGESAYWVSEAFFGECVQLTKSLTNTIEVSFTFDDGNTSDIDIAAPLLEAAGFAGRFFPLAGRLGAQGSLAPEHLRRLVTNGHTIGSHGMDHKDWTALDTLAQSEEWDDARTQLAEAAGSPITEAAIPFGRYSAAVLKGLKDRGYEKAYSSDGGAWTPGDWPISRTSPRADMTLVDIEDILLGRENLLRKVRRHLARKIKARR